MKFPKHMSLSIEHNNHKNYYSKIIDYINDDSNSMNKRKHLTDDEYKDCLKNDEIWEMQWYPDSPISFYYVCAPTLQEALEKMNKEY